MYTPTLGADILRCLGLLRNWINKYPYVVPPNHTLATHIATLKEWTSTKEQPLQDVCAVICRCHNSPQVVNAIVIPQKKEIPSGCMKLLYILSSFI